MTLEDFKNLAEVQKIDLQIEKYLSEIDSHNNRVNFLKRQKKEREEELSRVNEKLKMNKSSTSELEKDLFNKEKELEKAKEHLNLVTTEQQVKALEKEIKLLTPQVDQISEQILDLIESEENLLKEKNTYDNYLSGIDKTILEVQTEVTTDIEKEKKEIKRVQDRIDNLLEISDKSLSDMFKRVNEKFRFKKPLAIVQNNCCSGCRYQIPAIERQEVELGKVLLLCPGCGRLLSPLSAH